MPNGDQVRAWKPQDFLNNYTAGAGASQSHRSTIPHRYDIAHPFTPASPTGILTGVDDYTQEEVGDWIQAIEQLYSHVVGSSAEAREATHPVAKLWSGGPFGYIDAPLEIQRAFIKAVELGYVKALQDVRNGEYPDLA